MVGISSQQIGVGEFEIATRRTCKELCAPFRTIFTGEAYSTISPALEQLALQILALSSCFPRFTTHCEGQQWLTCYISPGKDYQQMIYPVSSATEKNIDQSADCRRRLACPRCIQGSKAVEQALQSYNKLHVVVFHHTLTPDIFSVLTSCKHTLHFVGTLVESRVRCVSTPYM